MLSELPTMKEGNVYNISGICVSMLRHLIYHLLSLSFTMTVVLNARSSSSDRG